MSHLKKLLNHMFVEEKKLAKMLRRQSAAPRLRIFIWQLKDIRGVSVKNNT